MNEDNKIRKLLGWIIIHKSTLIGILLIVVGTLLISIINSKIIVALGVVLNGTGIFIITRVSSISIDKIDNKIEKFRKELTYAKEKTNDYETLEKIISSENEFEKWAEEFTNNFESKQIEKKQSDLNIKKNEIRLSND